MKHRLKQAAGPRECYFDLQPCLIGEILELRPLRAGDYQDLYAVAADPLIWEQHPCRDRCQEEVFKVFFREALASGGALLALDRKDGRAIGSSRFHGCAEGKSEVEIGWTFLARSHWGGAYNGEMKRLMLRHAFRFVTTAIFLVGPHNFRSQRAVEKIGGVRAGTSLDASGRDSLVYRIEASAYANWGWMVRRHLKEAEEQSRMDVTDLPFNRLIGLEQAAPDSGFLVSLPDSAEYTNHLATVHASALLAVAEAGSGAFLLRHFGSGEGFVPVVRRLEARFRKPASGRVSARASVAPDEVGRWSAELAARGRVSAAVPIEVVDGGGVVVMSATVEWFIARASHGSASQRPRTSPA